MDRNDINRTKGRKSIDDMTQEELDQNWKKAEVQLERLTPEESAKFVNEGGVMWGTIERLVAEGIDLKTWEPDQE